MAMADASFIHSFIHDQTPEGLDQNPAYYELLQEAAFKDTNEANLTDWLVKRAHRRYGLPTHDQDVGSAWADIGRSGYANDGQVHDPTAVSDRRQGTISSKFHLISSGLV
jgi:hypothetical protein